MLVVFFRAVLLYALVSFSLRLMGKRQLGELQPTELVITILISNIASLPIEDGNIPMILGMIPVLTLVSFEIIVSNVSLRSRRFRAVVSGRPAVVVREGRIDQKELHRLRFSIDDLMESLRQQGIFDIQDVEYAIVETTGKISVLQKFAAQTVTPRMLHIQGKDKSPPVVAVSDGQIVKSALQSCGLDEAWLTRRLEKEGRALSEIFLMTVDQEENTCIILKEG